ncbi:MAG: hypothetical protein AAGF60_06915 [Pseudomonadota bacterium]
MFALLRLVVVGFVVLSIVYICVSLYSRSVRRGRLDAEWELDQPPMTREAYIRKGMTEYEQSLRPKLILGVYLVPTLLICLIVYLTNFA